MTWMHFSTSRRTTTRHWNVSSPSLRNATSLKGRACAGGRVRLNYIGKDQSSSPTISTESHFFLVSSMRMMCWDSWYSYICELWLMSSKRFTGRIRFRERSTQYMCMEFYIGILMRRMWITCSHSFAINVGINRRTCWGKSRYAIDAYLRRWWYFPSYR